MKKRKVLTRRQFMGAAAAMAAGPAIVPASALGLDGHIVPSERIRMGFIGQGGQGSGHLRGGAWTHVPGGYLSREEVQVMAVCDVRRERREEAAHAVNTVYAERFGRPGYNDCAKYVDFRELLARDDIDAVLIACPLHWHAVMAIYAVTAGKDVYCEKPVCVTIEQGRAMANAVARNGRVYQAGTQQRSEYTNKFRLAHEIIRAGRIGEIKEVYGYKTGGSYDWPAGRGKPRPVPDGFDWDLFLGPAQWLEYDGNGSAFRFAAGDINWTPHHFDFVHWVLGMDRTGPVEIWMEQGAPAFRYENGVVVYGRAYPGEPVGDVGGACFVGTEGRLAVDRENIVSYPAAILKNPPGPHEADIYRNTGHANNFLECIRTRQRTICDAETAHRSMTLSLLGGIALRLNRPLKWDPRAERFENDSEANRLMSVSTRPPWHT